MKWRRPDLLRPTPNLAKRAQKGLRQLGRLAVWLGWASLFTGIVGLFLESRLRPRPSVDSVSIGHIMLNGSALGGLVSLLIGLVTQRAAAVALALSTFVLAVGGPGLLPACCLNNGEASAIGSLRSINSSESTYSSSCGGKGYAQSLEDLAKPPEGSTAGFISPDLATNGVIKSGYIVTLSPDTGAATVTLAAATCNVAAADAISSYFVEAHPVEVGKTGQRSFATDSRGTIYFNNSGEPIRPGMAGASVLQ